MFGLAHMRLGVMPSETWDPVARLGKALLALWDAERSDTISTVGGTLNWKDLVSGTVLSQATAGLQPVYDKVGFGGVRPAMVFDGVDDYLGIESCPLPSGGADSLFYGLAEQTAAAADGTVRCLFGWGAGTTTARRYLRATQSGGNIFNASVGDGAVAVASVPVGSFSGQCIVKGLVQTNVQSASIDGGTPDVDAVTPSTAATRIRMGASVSAGLSQFWQGGVSVCAVIDPNHALWTPEAEAQLIQWLAGRKKVWFSSTEVAQANINAKAAAKAWEAIPVPAIGNFTYGLLPSMGQSNSIGTQSFPALTLSHVINGVTTGGRMIGDSIHGNATSGAWVQCGTLQLNPLVATVRGSSTGSLLDLTAQYALTPSDGNNGETMLEAAIMIADYSYCFRKSLTTSDRRIIAWAAGTGGQTLAAITTTYWARLGQGAVLAASCVNTLVPGLKPKHIGLGWQQGEDDSSGGTSYASYYTGLGTVRSQAHADITVAVCGGSPSDPYVPLVIGQTCARGISFGTAGLQVPQAQLDFALNEPDCMIYAPWYTAPKKGIHTFSNSTRMSAQRLGYIWDRRINLGLRTVPLAPYTIQVRGDEMLISFLVHTPPLKFTTVYDGDLNGIAAVNLINKGLYPWDDSGDLTVLAATLREDCSILLKCNRLFTTNPHCDAGRRSSPLGSTNIWDSTPMVQLMHNYDPAKGMSVEDSRASWTNQLIPAGFEACVFTKTATPV